jgi:RPA family protein
MGNELSRGTAFKICIREVTEGNFSKSESRWEPGYLLTRQGERVSRVRVMGTVVSRYVGDDQKYASLTLDDGGDTIAVRAFRDDVERLMNVKPGDIVDVIGKVKEYEGEEYINMESVWKVEDPNWELVRRLELLIKGHRLGGVKAPPVEEKISPTPVDAQEVEEEVVGEDPKIVLLNLIEELDDGNGVKYITLLKEAGLEEEELEGVLRELMGEGDIYEPKIGRFKRV